MKVIIQLPCYNEEETLCIALEALPRQLPGVDKVEWLVINDGSTDQTEAVAKTHGVDHIVSFPTNQGLARGFMAGLDACLRAGADIIVNTDADNQYCAQDIPKLIEPILEGQAEIVIGARPINQTEHFSAIKKILQRLGSWVVRIASGTDVPDSPSGFRAISREAALQLNVFNEYTYTLETIIQAGQKNIPITSVPIRTNADLRPSRLVKSIRSYVYRSIITIGRIFMVYRPLRFFMTLAAAPLLAGIALCVRWLGLFLWVDSTRARTPSLILAAILIFLSGLLIFLGLIADLLAVNRKLLEEVRVRVRRIEIAAHENDRHQENAS
jgi:glycosyltransferase involved in cell wall biosynthesis